MQDQKKDSASNTPKNQDRRQAIKKIAVGVGVLAGYSVLPNKWTQPIVGQIALPAHAATSAASVASTETTAASTGAAKTQVFTLQTLAGNNKRFVWLDKTGSAYGGKVVFDFGSCGSLTVPDAAKSHGADGNASNHNQAFYFCGTDFKPGQAEWNQNRASVFAPPGCASSTVTMTYYK